MYIIGITGPSGCGKSTLTGVFRERGALILDADEIYHELLASDEPLRAALAGAFGESILKEDGIDRAALGKIVFADPEALLRLNGITHPRVCEVIRECIASSDKAVGVIDAPLLKESGLDAICNKTVGILAPREDRIGRIMARDGLSREGAERRTAAQKPDCYYIGSCDVILRNDGGFSEWVEKSNALAEELTGKVKAPYEDIPPSADTESGSSVCKDTEGRDSLFEKAIQVILEAGVVTTSCLQRKLRIGYSEALVLIDRMEAEGIIGPPRGELPREILMRRDR